ncbi:guanylate kinase, partial [Diaporthe helianthi]
DALTIARNQVLSPDRRPVVISGPSAVGKSSLCQMLLDAHPGTLVTSVSHTTRKPRPGEVEGSSYYYVTRDEFEALIIKNTFIEYAEFNGNLYGTSKWCGKRSETQRLQKTQCQNGTSKQTIIDQTAKGSVVLLDIEMEGVKQMRQEQLKAGSQINPRFLFIKPPSFAVLEARLRGRGTEDEGSVQRRLAQARAELDYAETGVHDKIIVNHDLGEAYQELEDFIFNKSVVDGQR